MTPAPKSARVTDPVVVEEAAEEKAEGYWDTYTRSSK